MMAPRQKRIVLIVAAVAAFAALLIWLQGWRSGPQTVFQGYVEGNFVYAAPESGGRLTALHLTEGDTAQAGQPAFTLDDRTETALRNEAEARLNQAKAQLEDLKAAQQRPEQIAVLKAQEDQAKALREQTRIDLERQKMLLERGYTSKAAYDQAQTAHERATAALSEAQRHITAAELAARTNTISAAEAAVRVGDAALAQATVALNRRAVQLPQNGKVQDIFFRVGEVVNPGQPVLALLPPGNVKYRFYVPAPLFSTIRIGQSLRITCDACPTDLTARISFISTAAEFTPPVIFSDEERAKLVFKIEAVPAKPVELPVGLPVKIHTDGVEIAPKP